MTVGHYLRDGVRLIHGLGCVTVEVVQSVVILGQSGVDGHDIVLHNVLGVDELVVGGVVLQKNTENTCEMPDQYDCNPRAVAVRSETEVFLAGPCSKKANAATYIGNVNSVEQAGVHVLELLGVGGGHPVSDASLAGEEVVLGIHGNVVALILADQDGVITVLQLV